MTWELFLLLLAWMVGTGHSGSPCPPSKNVYPCFCSQMQDKYTVFICPGIENRTALEKVTESMKSLIVDRIILLNLFLTHPEVKDNNPELNAVLPPGPGRGFNATEDMLPNKWLAELRIKELEIQRGNVHSCFLCDDALQGQSEYFSMLIINGAGLRGHVCSTCLSSSGEHLSTRELRRTPLVTEIDFSQNDIEILDGNCFPASLTKLKKIVLSNNRINKVNDNAFSNLHSLEELDLSRNRLSAFSRRIFRPNDNALQVLDLSYNSIQTLPEDMFHSLNALKEVELSHNLLETLPETTWSRMRSVVEKVDVRGNFLVCNCSMKWIGRRMSKSTKLIGHCVGPQDMAFQEIKSTLTAFASC